MPGLPVGSAAPATAVTLASGIGCARVVAGRYHDTSVRFDSVRWYSAVDDPVRPVGGHPYRIRAHPQRPTRLCNTQP